MKVRNAKTLTIVVRVWCLARRREPTQPIDVKKRAGESDDKLVMNRQRQGTLPRYDHHLCSDSSAIEKSSHKARMTKLITSDETLEERVIAVGKKRNLHPVYYQ